MVKQGMQNIGLNYFRIFPLTVIFTDHIDPDPTSISCDWISD